MRGGAGGSSATNAGAGRGGARAGAQRAPLSALHRPLPLRTRHDVTHRRGRTRSTLEENVRSPDEVHVRQGGLFIVQRGAGERGVGGAEPPQRAQRRQRGAPRAAVPQRRPHAAPAATTRHGNITYAPRMRTKVKTFANK